jgi:hypothetical protein
VQVTEQQNGDAKLRDIILLQNPHDDAASRPLSVQAEIVKARLDDELEHLLMSKIRDFDAEKEEIESLMHEDQGEASVTVGA